MNFLQKLEYIQEKNDSLVCVGLDSDLTKIPKHLLKKNEPVFQFNKAIIDATCDLVCAYKANIAFYEAGGINGLKALKKTITYIKNKYPKIVVIVDAKRADIGNTNLGYVKSIFDYYQADAATVNPYLGKQAIEPFLKRKDKGIIILCKTSNQGGKEFQDLIVYHQKLGKVPLYLAVAYNIAHNWNKKNNCGLVIGATYPEELKKAREVVGDMPFLIPGVGAQGGDVEKTVKLGQNSKGKGIIINSSRSIIFASNKHDFVKKARQETEKLKDLVNVYKK